MAARSPVTLPSHHAGQPPAHAGHLLPPEVLTPEEARALLRVPSPRAPTGIRNRALLAVLYRGGLRISEAFALERRDLHAAACAVTVRHGKGNRHRTIGMDPAALALVARWLDERRQLALHRPGVVFCTLDGHPLQASYVRPLLPRLARKAGIEKRTHPHGLHHTCAAELAIEGVPVPLIQQQLGHASLHTTMVYLRHITPVELVEKMRTRSWSLESYRPVLGRHGWLMNDATWPRSTSQLLESCSYVSLGMNTYLWRREAITPPHVPCRHWAGHLMTIIKNAGINSPAAEPERLFVWSISPTNRRQLAHHCARPSRSAR